MYDTCNTLKHPRHNKPNWESFPSSTAYKEIFERWRPTFNKQKLTLDWSKNTSLKKVFATDIVHNSVSWAVHARMKKEKKLWKWKKKKKTWEEIKQQDEGVFQKQADGWMPWGWRGTWHQVVVGFDSLTRLWRASHQMHPHTPASIHPSVHPSLSPTFFPLCIWSEQILFSTRPPWGTVVLTSIHPERRKEAGEKT